MADVRAMLKAERAARAPVKESRQPTHTQEPSTTNGKKRKAADDAGLETRKRTKEELDANVPAGFFDHTNPDGKDSPVNEQVASQQQAPNEAPPPIAINEDEWDAFQREVAKTPPPTEKPVGATRDALRAGATISAAPLTAAELAARDAEEKNAQRTRRDEELADEKEEASRQLEEEFEEMEALENRVRLLKAKREALRKGEPAAGTSGITTAPDMDANGAVMADANDESDEEDDDNEDWDDGWRFRPA